MTLEELGRRAVACKHWRWMPGMAWFEPPSGAPDDDGDYGRINSVDFGCDIGSPAYPDLSDPCTLGGLLALVREAWKENVSPTYWPEDGGDPAYWAIEIDRWYDGDTEGASLVAALEAAP